MLSAVLVLLTASRLALSAPTPSSSSASYQCEMYDGNDGKLVSTTTTSEGYLACYYESAGTCEYAGAAFRSGTSTCPGAKTGYASQQQSQCPQKDVAGGALFDSGIVRGGFVQCSYEIAGTCEYFGTGSFSSGSSNCPPSIGSPSPPVTPTAGVATCVAKDDAGGALITSGASADKAFVECQYANAGACVYFNDGSFSSGGSTCPDGITPNNAAAPPSNAVATCVAKDDAGGALISSGASADNKFVECEYAQAGQCVYFNAGSFSSGSSTCPDSITAPSSVSANAKLSSSDSGSSFSAAATTGDDNDGASLSPVYIALIVMNAVLVLGILTLGFFYVREARGARASRDQHLKVMYAKVDAARDEMSMPFTASKVDYPNPHDNGRYSD
ncbi:hypothetical protein MKEN_00491800 [Mycena kentingensis (nom. inval.)]|nr:hypothetical protein MKEN_00491800 [Mycena kentingensis (nom. inval.)]